MYSTHARMVPGTSMARACPAASPRHVCVRAVKKPQESAPNHLQALGIMMGTAALLASGPADASLLPVFGNNTNQVVQQVKATPKTMVAPSVYSTNEVMSVSIVPNSLEELDDKVNKSLEEAQSGPGSAPIKPGQELRPGAALESVQAKLPLKPEAGKDDATLISKPVGNGTGEPTSAGPQTPEGVEAAKGFLKNFLQQGDMTFALVPNSLEELDDKVNKSLEESQSGPASAPVQPGIELRPGAGIESQQDKLPLKTGTTTISQPVGNGSGEPSSDKTASNTEPVGPQSGPARVNGPASIAGIPLNSGEPVSAGPVTVGGGGPTNPDGSVPTVAPGIKGFLSSFLRPGTMTFALVPNSLEELDDKVNKSLEESQSGPASAPVQPGIELRPGAGIESTQDKLPLKNGTTTISQPVGNGSGEPTSDKSVSNEEPVGPQSGPALVNGPYTIAGIPLNSGEPVSAGPVTVGGGGPTNPDGSVPTVAPGIKGFLSSFLRPGDMNLTLGAMPNSLQELDEKVNASLKESDEGPATAPKKFGVPTRPSAPAESNPASLPLQGNGISNFFKGIFGQGDMTAQFTPENKQGNMSAVFATLPTYAAQQPANLEKLSTAPTLTLTMAVNEDEVVTPGASKSGGAFPLAALVVAVAGGAVLASQWRARESSAQHQTSARKTPSASQSGRPKDAVRQPKRSAPISGGSAAYRPAKVEASLSPKRSPLAGAFQQLSKLVTPAAAAEKPMQQQQSSRPGAFASQNGRPKRAAPTTGGSAAYRKAQVPVEVEEAPANAPAGAFQWLSKLVTPAAATVSAEEQPLPGARSGTTATVTREAPSSTRSVKLPEFSTEDVLSGTRKGSPAWVLQAAHATLLPSKGSFADDASYVVNLDGTLSLQVSQELRQPVQPQGPNQVQVVGLAVAALAVAALVSGPAGNDLKTAINRASITAEAPVQQQQPWSMFSRPGTPASRAAAPGRWLQPAESDDGGFNPFTLIAQGAGLWALLYAGAKLIDPVKKQRGAAQVAAATGRPGGEGAPSPGAKQTQTLADAVPPGSPQVGAPEGPKHGGSSGEATRTSSAPQGSSQSTSGQSAEVQEEGGEGGGAGQAAVTKEPPQADAGSGDGQTGSPSPGASQQKTLMDATPPKVPQAVTKEPPQADAGSGDGHSGSPSPGASQQKTLMDATPPKVPLADPKASEGGRSAGGSQ